MDLSRYTREERAHMAANYLDGLLSEDKAHLEFVKNKYQVTSEEIFEAMVDRFNEENY